jgi:hypothetical protein
MRAEEEYVPAIEDEHENVEEKLQELDHDQTEEEEVAAEAERAPDLGQLEMVRRVAVVEIVRDLIRDQSIEGERMNVLTHQEKSALEFLKAAIDGRTRGGKFMYAEDRLQQLNVVLADLQPLMAVGGMDGLDQTLVEIVDGIDELRYKLVQLEEAQEEVFREGEEKKKDKPDEGDEDDKPDEDAEGEVDEEKAEAATSSLVEAETPGEKPAEVEKKPGLWSRLTGRGKPGGPKDEGGGGGGA